MEAALPTPGSRLSCFYSCVVAPRVLLLTNQSWQKHTIPKPSPRLEEEASEGRRVSLSSPAQSLPGSGSLEDMSLGHCLARGFLRHQDYVSMDLRSIASVCLFLWFNQHHLIRTEPDCWSWRGLQGNRSGLHILLSHRDSLRPCRWFAQSPSGRKSTGPLSQVFQVQVQHSTTAPCHFLQMEAKSVVTVSSHNYFMITTVDGQDINRSNRESQDPQI